jgi:signal transduction histidine kinase
MSFLRSRFPLIHLFYGAGFALAVSAIVAITWLGASRQNAQFLATQDIIANAQVKDAYTYLRGQVRQMVYWQDAFDNTVKHWDNAWVSYQFGAYQDTMGNYRTVLVDANGKLRFVHAPANDKALTAKELQRSASFGQLLRKVMRAGVHQPPPMIEGVVVSGGQPYFAVASLATPEQQSDLAPANRNPIAVAFLSPIRPAKFNDFAKGFEATDIHITAVPSHHDGHREFALNDASGQPVAWLHWKPHLPGTVFLKQVAAPLGLVLIAFMLIQMLVIMRWLALQRRMFQAQAEARAATEQSRPKSVFLGTISHELRTPLNAIIGYAEVLNCQLFGPLGNPRNGEYVRDIQNSGQALLKTVNDLIEIARIEAQEGREEPAPFNAAHAVRQAVAALQNRIREKSLRVALLRSADPVGCRGSLPALAQAIERILSNAVRHSPKSGVIAVEMNNDGRHVTIAIRDQGEGIAPERLEDLTRPFGHPDNHLVATAKGLGFGIPIAKGLVQSMGGTLTIESELGAGTTVRIILPADHSIRDTDPAAEEEVKAPNRTVAQG